MGSREKKGQCRPPGLAKLKRRRRLLPLFLLPALLLGYAFYDVARPVAYARLIDPQGSPPEDRETAGHSSPETAETPTLDKKAGFLKLVERRKFRASVSGQPTSSHPENTCDDLAVLVDRENHLPPDYVPPNLVSVQTYGTPTYGGEMLLRRGAAQQLGRMVRAANAAGEQIVVSSAYRSYAQQDTVFARLVSIYGTERAKWTSAPPGQSQHQLGTAVDFTNSAVGYQIHKSFGHTTASAWLKEQAPEYGFVLAYPHHKEAETGYHWEPWHYRYIGKENVRRMRERGANLQEFLTHEGVRPHCRTP